MDAHGLDREQHGKVLPRERHPFVLGRDLDLMLDDRRRLSHEDRFFGSDIADDPDGQPGPWERLPFRDPDTEGPRDRSDLVFVEVPERLDELELHVRGKARDVVMSLDSVPQLSAALDPVRRDRPLDEGIGTEGLCLPLEQFNEFVPDDGPFFLGIRDSAKGSEELVRGPQDPMVHLEIFQSPCDVFRLVLSHEPGVDVHREEAIAQGVTREDRGGRAVDAARTGDDRLSGDALPNALHLLGDEGLCVERHSPSVRESSRTHFFIASRWSLSFSARRSSLRARISTARIPAFSPRSRPTAATGTPGGICDTLRTASRLSLPLTGTPMTGFVGWAGIVPGRAAESPATPMKTRAVVFRIRSRRRSGVRWADATTISYSIPNSARIEPAFLPTSASLLEPRMTSTSTAIAWDKEGSRIKACALSDGRCTSCLALHDGEQEKSDGDRGPDDRREDHADRLDDDVDQDNAGGARPGVPAPEDSDDEASDEKPDPDLSALAAAEIRRKGTREDQEETERQEQDGHEIHNRIPDIEASHRISP